MDVKKGKATVRLLGPATMGEPYALYEALRTEDPVHWSAQWRAWVLTRYADVAACLRDQRLSAKRIEGLMGQLGPPDRERLAEMGRIFGLQMVFTDPPAHTRLRALANKAFTPRVVDRMRPYIQALVDELLDAAEGAGRIDVIRDLAYPLPCIVIAQMLGVRPEDRERFKGWSDDIASFIGTGHTVLEVAERAHRSTLEITEYFRGVVAERRARPGDDLMSALIRAEQEGDALTEDELLAMCVLLLIAGHETTTNLIGNGVLALLRHPEEERRLREDPELIETAVEELLRYDSPVQFTMRVAAEDVEIGERRIAAGQGMLLMIGAANRDPEQFSDPDRLDVSRQPNRHLSFGLGGHFCLGAPLARAEGQIAISTLLRRFPSLRLGAESLEWSDNIGFHGVKALPVSFG